MSEKIQPSHIEREAYVYIRQSTMQQVRTLGALRNWLGRAPRLRRLLAAVCSGKVGVVLALEASRLARNTATGTI